MGPSLEMSRWLHPFVVSLSKGPSAEIWFHKLTTNGYRWFDKLTTNGIFIAFYGKEREDSLQGGWMNRRYRSF